jgi:hypothetical protein
MQQPIFSCQQAKRIDMVDYLAFIGHFPKKVRSQDHWFVSPFREEKESSFKVNRHLNCWYDHGEGRGGNLIDFGILYHLCSISDFLQRLKSYSSFQQPIPVPVKKDPEGSCLHIRTTRALRNHRLTEYLRQRCIPLAVAGEYCSEVSFQIRENEYVAIGFLNRSSGYELRNEYFKGSSSPKDLTLIDWTPNAGIIAVFEGFFDFLSYVSIHQNQPQPLTNFLILNTLAHFEKAREIMDRYQAVHLYLDRDGAGRKYTNYALSLHKRYEDFSNLYSHYKDLNEWIMYLGHLKIPETGP